MVGRPFQKGTSGNPSGKPRGCRNRASRVVEHLLEGEARELAKVAIDLAKAGDGPVLRAILDRIAPPRRDRPIKFSLPQIASSADLPLATAKLIEGVASGEITPSEAAELGRLVDAHVKAVETADIAVRLAAVERAAAALSTGRQP